MGRKWVTSESAYGHMVTAPELAPDEVLVVYGTPCHTTCPYDAYERIMAEQAEEAFADARMDVEIVVLHNRAAAALPTGPGGRRRFGDDMMPGTVAAIVKAHQKEAAQKAVEDHKAKKYREYREWMDQKIEERRNAGKADD